jgi:hypothetical protein
VLWLRCRIITWRCCLTGLHDQRLATQWARNVTLQWHTRSHPHSPILPASCKMLKRGTERSACLIELVQHPEFPGATKVKISAVFGYTYKGCNDSDACRMVDCALKFVDYGGADTMAPTVERTSSIVLVRCSMCFIAFACMFTYTSPIAVYFTDRQEFDSQTSSILIACFHSSFSSDCSHYLGVFILWSMATRLHFSSALSTKCVAARSCVVARSYSSADSKQKLTGVSRRVASSAAAAESFTVRTFS